jgi:hypothetical protein
MKLHFGIERCNHNAIPTPANKAGRNVADFERTEADWTLGNAHSYRRPVFSRCLSNQKRLDQREAVEFLSMTFMQGSCVRVRFTVVPDGSSRQFEHTEKLLVHAVALARFFVVFAPLV